MKVAAAKYPLERLRDFSAFAEKQQAFLHEAKTAGAELVVLPEYLSLELAGLSARASEADLAAALAATQALHGDWMALYAALAAHLGMHINAGSFLLDAGGGRYRNRSYLFAPDGRHLWQDKLRLSGFEKKTRLIEAGDALKVYDIGGVHAAVALGYDCEFPLPVRAQCEAGARLLLVPSCTDSAAGATRVRVGCLARALENRCFVAQAAMAGAALWPPALGEHTGEAALIAPMDVGLPHDGMIVETRHGRHWAIAELDFAALAASRADAHVANDRDWASQYFPTIQRARLEAAGDHACAA